MLGIKALIQLAQQHHLPVPSPATDTNWNRQWFEFYTGVREGAYSSEDQAVAVLFGTSPVARATYQALKSACREALIGQLSAYNTELEQQADPSAVYNACYRQWLSVRAMTGENAHTFALELAHQLLRIAAKFDFTQLCTDISLYLRIQYCLREPEEASCREADQRYRYYRDLRGLEYEAEKSYATLAALMADGTVGKMRVRRAAQKSLDAVQPALRRYPSAQLYLYGALIKLVQFALSNDYSLALQTCDRAIRFFQNRPYQARMPLQVFYYHALICCVQLKRLKKGREAFRQNLELAEVGDYNRLKVNELYFLLLLHTGRYAMAGQLASEVLGDPNFGYVPPNLQGVWIIYRAYLAYLLRDTGQPRTTGAHDAPLAWSSLETAGRIIRFLESLRAGALQQASDEVGEMEAYSRERLKGEHTRRSRLFIQLLLQVRAQQFDRAAVERAAKPILKQLAAIPIQIAYQTDELEIVPYEVLWQYALSSLPETKK